MGVIWKYGDVLRARGRRPGTIRVQYIRIARHEELAGKSGLWFYGMTIRGDDGMSGASKIGRINLFPYGQWRLDD